MKIVFPSYSSPPSPSPLPRLVIRRQSSFSSAVDKDLLDSRRGGEREGMRIDIGIRCSISSLFFVPFLRLFYPKFYIYIYIHTIDDYIFLKHSPANDEIPPDTKKEEKEKEISLPRSESENPRLVSPRVHLFPRALIPRSTCSPTVASRGPNTNRSLPFCFRYTSSPLSLLVSSLLFRGNKNNATKEGTGRAERERGVRKTHARSLVHRSQGRGIPMSEVICSWTGSRVGFSIFTPARRQRGRCLFHLHRKSSTWVSTDTRTLRDGQPAFRGRQPGASAFPCWATAGMEMETLSCNPPASSNRGSVQRESAWYG